MMDEIHITTEYIKLQQVLKLAGITSQGSESKFLILEGKVKVNGEIIIQRGKKVKSGDKIKVEGFSSFLVV